MDVPKPPEDGRPQDTADPQGTEATEPVPGPRAGDPPVPTSSSAARPIPPPPRPSMAEMRERFGRLTRDPNFWTLMDELGMESEDPPPANVTALPLERCAPPVEGEGRVVSGRFRRPR